MSRLLAVLSKLVEVLSKSFVRLVNASMGHENRFFLTLLFPYTILLLIITFANYETYLIIFSLFVSTSWLPRDEA